jgi:hypothetical protein
MKSVITINTTEDFFYKEYFTLLNPILGVNKLSPQEIELFAELCKLNHKYSSIPLEERNLIIFNTINYKKIIIALNYKRQQFDNLMLSLKKKKFIIVDKETGNKKLNQVFTINPVDNKTLTFNFKINDSN